MNEKKKWLEGYVYVSVWKSDFFQQRFCRKYHKYRTRAINNRSLLVTSLEWKPHFSGPKEFFLNSNLSRLVTAVTWSKTWKTYSFLKMGEIEFGPRNSAMWPQRKSFKSRRPCTQETEKEVLAQEIQQSGPRKNCLKVRVLVPKKRKRKS